MSERQDIHVHVEQDEPRWSVAQPSVEPAEKAAAASFFTAQILWIVIIAILVVLLLAAFGSGVVDFGGENGGVDPTAVP